MATELPRCPVLKIHGPHRSVGTGSCELRADVIDFDGVDRGREGRKSCGTGIAVQRIAPDLGSNGDEESGVL